MIYHTRKKFLKLPPGLTAFKHNHHMKSSFGVSLRITVNGPSYSVRYDNYQSQYHQALLWLKEHRDTDIDPEQSFPYDWDEFLDLLELKSELFLAERLVNC